MIIINTYPKKEGGGNKVQKKTLVSIVTGQAENPMTTKNSICAQKAKKT